MSRRFVRLTALLLLLALCALPVSARADSSFLIGDWSTSDGVSLSFFKNGSFTMAWGFFPEEEGSWEADDASGDAFRIEMEGSSILSLMSMLYGSADSSYHFEILKCNADNFYLVQVYGSYTARTSPCKLGFTRVGARQDLSIPAESTPKPTPAPTSAPAPTPKPDPNAVTVKPVELYWHDQTVTVDLRWGWSMFDANASEYNHDLAIAALTISQLIHQPDDFESRISDIFGFEDVELQRFSVPGIPAFALANREVNFGGQRKHVVLLAIRGTNLVDGPNDVVTDIEGQFNGFRTATVYLNTVLAEYIEARGFQKADTILFFTGHSLGGGVAQSLAPFAEHYTDSDENCFVYTFAATNVFVDGIKTLFHDYSNVHNIVNKLDAVPYLPLLFGKYGHQWYYDSGEARYRPYYDRVYKDAGWDDWDLLFKHDITTYFAMMLCALPDNMGDGARSSYSLVSVRCPVDLEVFDGDGARIGYTEGAAARADSRSGIVVLTQGDEKLVLAPESLSYSLRITGTDDGAMTVTRQTVDLDAGEVLREQVFRDVPVEKGRSYALDVPAYGKPEAARLADAPEEAPSGTPKQLFARLRARAQTLPKWVFVSAAVLLLALIVAICAGASRRRRRRRRRR